MARSVDSAKRQMWRERLQRFERGRSTIAALPGGRRFHRVLLSVAADTRPPAHSAAALAPLLLNRQPKAATRQTFLLVEVVAAATIDIHLPNGACLTVPAGDAAALEAAVVVVARLPRKREEIEPCWASPHKPRSISVP